MEAAVATLASILSGSVGTKYAKHVLGAEWSVIAYENVLYHIPKRTTRKWPA
jgi:hypothetical protein